MRNFIFSIKDTAYIIYGAINYLLFTRTIRTDFTFFSDR